MPLGFPPKFTSQNLAWTLPKRWGLAFSVVLWAIGLTALLLFHRLPTVDVRFAWTSLGIVISVGAFSIFHLRHVRTTSIEGRKVERVLAVASLLTVMGVQIIQHTLGATNLLGDGFLLFVPVVAHAMLVSATLGPSTALFSSTILAFLMGYTGAMNVEMLVASWLTAAVGTHAVNPMRYRSDLLRALSIQAVAMVVLATLVAASLSSTVGPVLVSAGWALVAAIGAISIFWLAIAIFEKAFGMTSDWSLLELCSPEHPLIRELCMRAPGTYAHSVMVGNLAENCAREIGANAVICRAMAHFHDVGKLARPGYFIENQLGSNLHDRLAPTVSAMLIAKHVEDGLNLAKKHRLPQIVQDGIAQHHGTSLISYFYARAKAEQPDEDPEFEKLFRYPGPRPQTREAAILHLCDQVEAASRSIPAGSPEELDLAIARIIENSRAEAQLDECDLTFRDLQSIHRTLLRTLGALRHEREPYPIHEAIPAIDPLRFGDRPDSWLSVGDQSSHGSHDEERRDP